MYSLITPVALCWLGITVIAGQVIAALASREFGRTARLDTVSNFIHLSALEAERALSWAGKALGLVMPLHLLYPVVGLWLLAYWWAACRSYLRLPRPVLIAAAMTTVSLLTALLVGYLI